MMSYVFQHEIGAIHGIWASWHYSTKSSCQKYTAWVSGDPTSSCFCNMISLFWRNIQIFQTKLLHLSTFLVKQYTSLIFVKEKSMQSKQSLTKAVVFLNVEVFFRAYCLLLFSSILNVVKTCNNIETIRRVGNMEKNLN